MPPPLAPRPDAGDLRRADRDARNRRRRRAAAKPNPGVRTFQRLNRPEYARAVHDLLALDVDAGNWLPLDTKSANFDNIADAQALSPTLLEAYLERGERDQPHGGRRSPRADGRLDLQQPRLRVAASLGSRRGRAVRHARRIGRRARLSGRRRVRVRSRSRSPGSNARFEDIDVSIDGERVALIEYETGPAGGADGRGAVPMRTEPILIKAGQHLVAAAFVRKIEGPYEDLIRPHDWSFAGGGSGGPGITTLPHVRDLIIKGPYRVDRHLGDAEPREDLQLPADQRGGRASVRAADPLAPRQRSLSPSDHRRRARSPDAAVSKGGGEGRRSKRACAARSRRFSPARTSSSGWRRSRRSPSRAAPTASPISISRRACRSSSGARRRTQNCSRSPTRARCRCRRRSRSRRAACSPIRAPTRSARASPAQWLRLQDVDKVHPDPNNYPNFDDNLAAAMRRETELFFNSLVREDRSVARSLPRRLHLRERAAGAPLRLPRRLGRRVPPRRSIPTTRAAACSGRAACWCRPRSPTAPRRCCAASG